MNQFYPIGRFYPNEKRFRTHWPEWREGDVVTASGGDIVGIVLSRISSCAIKVRWLWPYECEREVNVGWVDLMMYTPLWS